MVAPEIAAVLHRFPGSVGGSVHQNAGRTTREDVEKSSRQSNDDHDCAMDRPQSNRARDLGDLPDCRSDVGTSDSGSFRTAAADTHRVGREA